ncbi:MAG TPA: urea carboxylase-associated family protein [Steroidobacteraceae bacterium]|jgi:uncharacterized protein|nr:urea carboxylase-associated family protein [Steroidobacteraceae bacterium]
MATQHIVSPGGGAGVKLARGAHIRLIDIEGGQTGDLMAFSLDGRERLSNGRSFDYNGKLLLSTGDVLWSDLSNPMLTIVADDVGRHDFLYASCSIEMYRMQYGVTGYHANCSDNLRAALRELGIEPDSVPTTAFNFFMNVEVQPDGRLKILPPKCRKGDSMVLRAEMDLAIAVSACPAGTCNDGPPRSLAFEVG